MHKISKFINRHIGHIESQLPPGSSSSDHSQALATPLSGQFPGVQDFHKYRKQRGVNLGSWFVLERWITDRPFRFAQSPATSDLDVARGTNAQEVLTEHWSTWITEKDWVWIAEHGINTVRIPIGFYHICGADASVLRGTDFADFGFIFQGAWGHILDAIVMANKYGIGVLIDLHAAPGKQNLDSHSGTSNPHPRFFDGSSNMQHTIHILRILLVTLTRFSRSFNPPLHNIVGIELLNEPAPGPHRNLLEKWYTDATRALRSIDPTIPLYIGDSWQTDDFALYIQNTSHEFSNIILDHHLYRCFTSEDQAVSAYDHAGRLWDHNGPTPQMFARVAEKLESSGGGLIIGEWSGALNPKSLDGLNNEKHARSQFIQAQVDLYERRCAGYFFWTYKKQWSGDKGWSFRDAVEGGIFPTSIGLTVKRSVTEYREDQRTTRRDAAKAKALGEHVTYWSQYPGQYYHWRFDHGFVVGWQDAYWFFGHSVCETVAPEMGFKGPWAKRRLQEHVQSTGSEPGLWEFEHGFRQGVEFARHDFVDMCCC